MDDIDLLKEFAARHSEEALRTLGAALGLLVSWATPTIYFAQVTLGASRCPYGVTMLGEETGSSIWPCIRCEEKG